MIYFNMYNFLLLFMLKVYFILFCLIELMSDLFNKCEDIIKAKLNKNKY